MCAPSPVRLGGAILWALGSSSGPRAALPSLTAHGHMMLPAASGRNAVHRPAACVQKAIRHVVKLTNKVEEAAAPKRLVRNFASGPQTVGSHSLCPQQYYLQSEETLPAAVPLLAECVKRRRRVCRGAWRWLLGSHPVSLFEDTPLGAPTQDARLGSFGVG